MTRKELVNEARKAAQRAYAPYSRFRVGAALVVETPAGPTVVTGANVENASFGLTLCAERAAFAAAMLVGQREGDAPPKIMQVAIACIDAPAGAPAYMRTPCGACRQWLAELAPGAVYYVDGIERDLTLDDLLPMAFVLESRAAEPAQPDSAARNNGNAKTSQRRGSAQRKRRE